ncbi:hypothetical protein QTI66_39420, partial [Variovorax sp. J22R133]|uniref:hypothetical protein n=1 Tax=Variovorax brevis TaxID=3053503 RepID=UPI002577B005
MGPVLGALPSLAAARPADSMAPELAMQVAPTTNGEIAALNLESARQASWSRFKQAPQLPGIAESIVGQEQMAAQFLGDLAAYDRLDALVRQLAELDAHAPRT